MASRSVDMQCWKCGTELENVLLPFSSYEECGKCRADLHAFFGDFFTVHTKAYRHRGNAAAQKARAALAEMFGEDLPAVDVDSIQTAQTEADQALAELKRLFGESE